MYQDCISSYATKGKPINIYEQQSEELIDLTVPITEEEHTAFKIKQLHSKIILINAFKPQKMIDLQSKAEILKELRHRSI